MTTWYVHREAGTIVWAGEYAQVDYAEEALDSATSVELQTFLTPTPPPIISATAFLDRLGNDGPALLASPFGFALIRLAAAGSIRLDDPDVVGGMQAAVNAGAITSKRAAELLAAP